MKKFIVWIDSYSNTPVVADETDLESVILEKANDSDSLSEVFVYEIVGDRLAVALTLG